MAKLRQIKAGKLQPTLRDRRITENVKRFHSLREAMIQLQRELQIEKQNKIPS